MTDCEARQADRQPFVRLLASLLLAVMASGCGSDLVPAQGELLVDGQPANGGQLFLTPVAGGSRAAAMVSPEGTFALRMEGEAGVLPGDYHVSYRHAMDKSTQERLAKQLAGRLTSSEMTVSYTSPRDAPLTVPASGSETLKIEIRPSLGWSRNLSD